MKKIMRTKNLVIEKNIRRLFTVFTIVLALFFQSPVSVYAQEGEKNIDVSEAKQVEIAGTKLLHLKSSIVNQEYDLYINLPRFYDDTTKTFPVLYLLDAQWDFTLLNALFGQQYYDGFVPGIIIVGITWGGDNPNYDQLRARDFTPTDLHQYSPTGGAMKFIQFIKQELIPFVDSKFRTTKNDRTLMGCSLGGLFTLYTLFNETDLFNRYVLTSPAIGWDNGVLYTYEKNNAEKNSDLSARVFMGIGEYENTTDFQKFFDTLKSRNYSSLRIQTKVLDGVGHSGGKAEGYTKGLQFVFAKSPISLSEDILNQYAGEYELARGFTVKISVDNGNLIVLTPDSNSITLYPESENEFYTVGQYLLAHFQKNSAGEVTGCQIEQYTGKRNLKKVN